ncbi:MAG TPA: hypothetical protein DEP23_10745 [Ruminococcaceae bacterium]|nr:hypothetical protein [Oscillospiraceae bacterium]
MDPLVWKPADFLREVLELRLPNPFIPDTPQRIACDTCQKMPIRFGKAIYAYTKNGDRAVKNLKWIPLVVAGWCRYLMGVDDDGNRFTPSPDPMLPALLPCFADIKLGKQNDITPIRSLLSDTSFFHVDLYKAGLGEKIEDYFSQMTESKGAVRALINRMLQDI